MLDRTTAQAAVDQSVRLPDYFGCQNCLAWRDKYVKVPEHRYADNNGWVNLCHVLQDDGACAKHLLAAALARGAVQIHLHLGTPHPMLEVDR